MRASSTTSEDIKQEQLTLPSTFFEPAHFPLSLAPPSQRADGGAYAGSKGSGYGATPDRKDNCFLKFNDDETWKAYLENPLTTTAIMSMQRDEESATALGILYDYYKVPMEKRIISNLELDKSQISRNGCYKDSSSDSINSNLDSKCYQLTEDVEEEEEGNVILSGEVTRLHMPEIQHLQQYSPSGSEYVTTTNYESMDSLHCTATSLYETLTVAENVSSTTSTCASNLYTSTCFNSSIPSDYHGEFFEYVMEAPKSLKQKENEPTMSYINKGQYYCITLREVGGRPWKYKSTQVMSVVQIVFGDGKQEEEQLRNWRYWHARQHTARQRVIDIADYKESCFIHEVDEFAHNAISFSWNVNDTAKIYVSCNCLSTDFSSQKGVKGQPLSLQIDTFLGMDRKVEPIHRGLCQLKVFCDKGAERKIRDEGRKAAKKAQKMFNKESNGADANNLSASYSPIMGSYSSGKQANGGIASSENAAGSAASISSGGGSGGGGGKGSARRLDSVYFKTVLNLSTPPVHFVPDIYSNQLVIDRRRSSSSLTPTSQTGDVGFFNGLVSSTTNGPDEDQTFLPNHVSCLDIPYQNLKRAMPGTSCDEGDFAPMSKYAKTGCFDRANTKKRIIIYVRKENDRVFDGIFLQEPTLKGLKDALGEKYHLQSERITTVLRKSKKGILVKVDDNMVRHYSNEDAFVMDVQTNHLEGCMSHHVTLAVV